MLANLHALSGWSLDSIWHLLFSSFSIANLIGLGAIAVAILTPSLIAAFIPNLRVVAICVAALAFSYSSVAGKFYHDGLVQKQAEWDRAIAAETVNGNKARTDAEHSVRAEPPSSVRNDPRNRDNWKRPSGK